MKQAKIGLLLLVLAVAPPGLAALDTIPAEPEAQYQLAQQYRSGINLPRDPARAATWFLMAAVQGHADAQYALGEAYYTGEGLPRLKKRALFWWLQAARQGHTDAQLHYGQALLKGDGVESDPALGREWLRKAAEQGHPEATRLLALHLPENTVDTPPSNMPEQTLSSIELAIEPDQSLTFENATQTTVLLEPASLPEEPKREETIIPPAAIVPPNDTEDDIPRDGPNKEKSIAAGSSTSTTPTTESEIVAPALRQECTAWLAQAPAQGFTIQLIATHRLSSVMTYIERHKLQGNYSLCAYDEYNALWFAIFYGHYDSLRAARAGLNALPDSLKRSKPYFRNLNKMRQLVRQDENPQAELD